MVTAADELLPLMIKGELDIALVPANVAAILYQKTEGQVSVIDINTLGVLYMVSGDAGIQSVKDLKGKTIYLTGKGTTPDYVLNYILSANKQMDNLSINRRRRILMRRLLLCYYFFLFNHSSTMRLQDSHL